MHKRLTIEEKWKVVRVLNQPGRPISNLADLYQEYPGRRDRERAAQLQTTTAMECVLAFMARLGRAAGLH